MENTERAKEIIKVLQDRAHETSLSKGWWAEHDSLRKAASDGSEDKDQAERLVKLVDELFVFARSMLIVSEVSEGIEARRNGNLPDDKLPEYPGLAVEFADVIIRIFDLAARFELPVIDALVDKLTYNTTREYKHGGKSL